MGNELRVNFGELCSYIKDVQDIEEEILTACMDAQELYQAFTDGTDPIYKGLASENLSGYFGSMLAHTNNLQLLAGALEQYLALYISDMQELDASIAEALRIK